VGLAFTCQESLLSALGPCQPWIRLDESALRAMLTPIGVDHIRIDAHLLTCQAPAPGGRSDHSSTTYGGSTAGTVGNSCVSMSYRSAYVTAGAAPSGSATCTFGS
jgi:hypothetical protein